MKFTDKYFFRRYGFDTALQASLSEECGLGAHSNIIVISKGKAGLWIERLYLWSHVSLRPWGVEISQQCPSCRRIRPWRKPHISSIAAETADGSKVTTHCIVHKCRFCPYSRSLDKPASLTYLGAVGECGRGEWHFTRRVISPDNT
jgi:hypothetical protein